VPNRACVCAHVLLFLRLQSTRADVRPHLLCFNAADLQRAGVGTRGRTLAMGDGAQTRTLRKARPWHPADCSAVLHLGVAQRDIRWARGSRTVSCWLIRYLDYFHHDERMQNALRLTARLCLILACTRRPRWRREQRAARSRLSLIKKPTENSIVPSSPDDAAPFPLLPCPPSTLTRHFCSIYVSFIAASSLPFVLLSFSISLLYLSLPLLQSSAMLSCPTVLILPSHLHVKHPRILIPASLSLSSHITLLPRRLGSSMVECLSSFMPTT
jgi:hypothetical protein